MMNINYIQSLNSYIKNSYVYKNVLIEDKNILPCKSSSQLTQYCSVINNYAESNHISIRFFDPRNMHKIMQPLAPGVELGGCVGIEITPNNFRQKKKYGLVNLFEYGDKTPFIKKMYDKLADMVETKENPFAKQQRETVLKLIKLGKLKA